MKFQSNCNCNRLNLHVIDPMSEKWYRMRHLTSPKHLAIHFFTCQDIITSMLVRSVLKSQIKFVSRGGDLFLSDFLNILKFQCTHGGIFNNAMLRHCSKKFNMQAPR